MTSQRLTLPPLTLSNLAWFEGDEAGEDSGLGLNRDYRDLRGMTTADLRRVLTAETGLINQVLTGDLGRGVLDDRDEEPELEIEGLELGTAAAVIALSVIGCIPYTSCNGGAFGGCHAADLPMVGFYMRPPHVKVVRDASALAGVQLTNDRSGGIYVVAEEPQSMIAFALKLGGLVD